jgi:hypothetical protein
VPALAANICAILDDPSSGDEVAATATRHDGHARSREIMRR